MGMGVNPKFPNSHENLGIAAYKFAAYNFGVLQFTEQVDNFVDNWSILYPKIFGPNRFRAR